MTEIERIKKEQEEKKKKQNAMRSPSENDKKKMITEDGTLAAFTFQDNYQ
jgi:hypothetical protein